MNIVLAQIEISENYKVNLVKMLNTINDNEFDILVFPELSLTSYNLKKATVIDDKILFKVLKKIQREIIDNKIIIVGTVLRKNNFNYNASAVISRKKIQYYFKNTLTEYDTEYFKKGVDHLTFKFKKFKIGLLLCRDQNNLKLLKQYKNAKCDILIHQSAHYYNSNIAIQKLDKNIAMPIVRAIDANVLFCKVNTVGYNGNKVSLGNSIVVDKNGSVLRHANHFNEEIIKYTIKG